VGTVKKSIETKSRTWLVRNVCQVFITDMYAKAAQGTSPTEAVKWAESELKKIYET
jgi:hypothetical protein